MLLLRSLLFDFLMYSWMAVLGILALPFALWSVDNTYKIMQLFLRVTFWMLRTICGLRWEVRGEIPDGEIMIAAKHQSFFDIMIIFHALPRAKFIMKKELKWAPILGQYALRIGSTPVDRGKKSAAMRDMVASVEAQEKGQIVIYPQGTRVPPGEVRPYKIGAGVLYQRMGRVAVPAATNAGVFWGRKSLYRRPGVAVVEFLEPIEPGLSVNDFVAEIERRIEPATRALEAEARGNDADHAQPVADVNFALPSLAALASLPFDDIIDVRSPDEFAEDHLPGAINLPVLDNEERARVGTIYVQDNRFRARRIGAALVAANSARHLEGPLADKEGGWRPLVYCWRGGQRSGSFSVILAQIGWQVGTLEGGYRRYRRLVVDALHKTPLPHRLVILEGHTGTAKTDLLTKVADLGVQVLDLEGLARHRGSVFGARPGVAQPAQKAFESALAMALVGLDPTRPVLVEAESSRIGAISLPPSLWAAMKEAPRLRIDAPLADRAAYLAAHYGGAAMDRAALSRIIDGLGALHSKDDIAAWQALASAGEDATLAAALMERHYDPRYTKSSARFAANVIGNVALPDLGEAALDAASREIAARLAAL